jgi:hypothetical protein
MKGSQLSNHSRKAEFSIQVIRSAFALSNYALQQNLQVNWVKGEVTVVSRTYQELHSFHLKV